MNVNEVNDNYFEWLYDYACGNRFSDDISYRKLLTQLHSTEFRFIIAMDKNRYIDGLDLRQRFSIDQGFEDNYLADCITGKCSVLEMMLALAIRCEETIMDDPRYGDRTGQWFWGMINSLGLGYMTDNEFDEKEFEFIINRFLDREYAPNGKGGLFTIKGIKKDLRKVEIWYQLNWYLDTIA